MIIIGDISKLEKLLENHQADFSIIRNKAPIYSVNDAKKYYSINETAPVLIITTDRGPYAVLISGASFPIDFNIIKKSLKSKEVKLLPREEVFNVVGFEIGNVPLVGLKIPCLMDKKLLDYSFVYGGISDANYTLKINPKDLARINNIISIIDFS